MKKIKILLMIASISGALVVAMGAVGSHALEEILSANDRTDTYQTAVRYHAIHTLAILIFCLMGLFLRSRHIFTGIYLMLAGMILFSGSLYFLSLFDKIWLAYITPFGGILLILSWIVLFFSIIKAKWDINRRE